MLIRQTGALIHFSDPLSNAQLFWLTVAATIVLVLAGFYAFILGARRQSPELSRELIIILRQFAFAGVAAVALIAVLPLGHAFKTTTVDTESRTVSIGRSFVEYAFMILFYNRMAQVYRFDEIKNFELRNGCFSHKCQPFNAIHLIAKSDERRISLTGRDASSRQNPAADAQALAILRRALRS